MATIGQPLPIPEEGWKRYDDTDPTILYTGNWYKTSNTGNWNKTVYECNGKGEFTFTFYGSKLRIYGYNWTNRSTNNKIEIDNNVVESYSEYIPSGLVDWHSTILLYEKKDLELKYHVVKVTNLTSLYMTLDAIDIDDIGYLTCCVLPRKTNLNDMSIGDCIPCRYTALTSGQAGYFSELGTCTAPEIPITGSATPDGLFYFIKVDKGTLIADRVVQHSISWDELNKKGYIEGRSAHIIHPYLKSEKSNPPFLASCDGSLVGAGGEVWRAFDGIYTVGGASLYNYLDYNNCTYVQLFVGSPKKCNIVKILSYSTSYNEGNWVVEGSNDEQNWIALSDSFKINTTSWITIELNNTYEFSYYRIKRDTNGREVVLFAVEFYMDSEFLIRSLSGGCAYADENKNLSLTDKGLGAWPVNNEWDKYIVNSDLNGKIAKGDDNIWNFSYLYTFCKDTTIIGLKNSDNNTVVDSSKRMIRGKNTGWGSIPANSYYGFRPVLEYLEPNSKATTLFY